MAGIALIKESLMICRASGITMMLWGHRGLGKSSLVQQCCVENGMGFVDLRCSQLEASDVRGLPDRGEDDRTHYLPPADMPVGDLTISQIEARLGDVPTTEKYPNSEAYLEAERQYYLKLTQLQPHFQNGILFLDELNRAQDDVLQAAFQLVLDRRVGQFPLPPGWCVAAAGNFNEGYQTNGFTDPAFLNRFCHLTLSGGETTLEEWINYMTAVHGPDATDVIEFASQNVKHLDGDLPGELGFAIQPSRRSWEMVTKVLKVTNSGKFSERARDIVIAGLIGPELAQSFTRYSCPVKPRELLARGVKPFEGELKKLNRNQMVGLMWGLVSFCKGKIDEEKVADVCLDYASWMCAYGPDKDLVVAFCRAMVSSGSSGDNQDKARAAVVSNPKLAQMIGKFNKKQGGKRNFVDRLNERPDLQKALAKVAWGTGADDI